MLVLWHSAAVGGLVCGLGLSAVRGDDIGGARWTIEAVASLRGP